MAHQPIIVFHTVCHNRLELMQLFESDSEPLYFTTPCSKKCCSCRHSFALFFVICVVVLLKVCARVERQLRVRYVPVGKARRPVCKPPPPPLPSDWFRVP